MGANGVRSRAVRPESVDPSPDSARSSKGAPARPRIIIIGAGSRGNAYARAIVNSTTAIVHAIAEPVQSKRQDFGQKYIPYFSQGPRAGREFEDWQSFLSYELDRRAKSVAGQKVIDPGVDAAFICTLDEQHAETILGLAPLNLHIFCEKPLATTLADCVKISASILQKPPGVPEKLFSIGHVLRYSPHNNLLRNLALHRRAVGDIVSVELTEPVGNWHFSHSYVRGNWRSEDATAPSLLTKSCHDMDLLLWLLSAPADPNDGEKPHLPFKISSSGQLNYFRKARKPAEAKNATNCLSCPIERSCQYSAKKIYVEQHLRNGNADWPVKIVNHRIAETLRQQGPQAAEQMLLASLAENYTPSDSDATIRARPWFGRCVWECDNDVLDDQSVTITWDDEQGTIPRFSKTATFHMIAHTKAQSARRGIIYGTHGTIHFDSTIITVFRFDANDREVFHPKQMPGGHGGGDDGLVMAFVQAMQAVMKQEMSVAQAQKGFLGCDVMDVLRSHALCFAAEEARREAKIVDWKEWWDRKVQRVLDGTSGRAGSEWDVGSDNGLDW